MFLVRMSSARDDWDAQTTREEAGAEAEAGAWAEEREGRSVERRVVERETDWRDRLAPPVLVLVLVRRLTACRSMLWLSVFNLVSGVVTAEERSGVLEMFALLH